MIDINDIINDLQEYKLKDIKLYNFNKTSPFYDYFVIATSQNNRQADAVSSFLDKKYKNIAKVQGKATGWMLIDLDDVVVHIFDKENRDYYSLDKMLFSLLDKEYENII